MNRNTLYDQVFNIFKEGGEPSNLEQVKLLLHISDLINKAKDKERQDLPEFYFEKKVEDLTTLIEGITTEEVRHLYYSCYAIQKASQYKDAEEPKIAATTPRKIPWWMQIDALKHGLPDHFKVGPDSAGHGVEQIIHQNRVAS